MKQAKIMLAPVAAAAVILLACNDAKTTAPQGSAHYNGTEASPKSTGGRDLVSTPRIRVVLATSGVFAPHGQVQVVASVTALMATKGVKLQVVVPEASAASRNQYRDLGMLAGYHPDPIVSGTKDLAQGEKFTLTQLISIPVSGYYSIAVTASTADEEPNLAGHATATEWMLVLPEGGRRTATFDAALMPDSVEARPGPLMLKGRYRRPQPERAPSRLALAGPTKYLRPPVSKEATALYAPGVRRLTYYDAVDNVYYPLPLIRYTWSEFDPYTNSTSGGSSYTDDQGYFTEPCPTDNGSYYNYMSGTITTYSTFAHARHNSNDVVSGWDGGTPSTCLDQTGDWTIADVKLGAIHRNAVNGIAASSTIFGTSHYGIDVRLYDTASNAHFIQGAARIDIDTATDHVLGDGGRATFSHEYGHFFHYYDLGGIGGAACPSSGHTLTQPSNLSCAFVEGFAQFHMAVVEGRGNVLANVFYTNAYFPYTSDTVGALMEDPVANFMLTLIDSVPMTAVQVANTVGQCRVDYGLLTGTDDFVYCMERTIDATIKSNYFTTRSPKPSAITTLGPLPSGWSQATVRRLWKRSLYKK